MKVLTLCGSLGARSTNRALLRAAPAFAPAGMTFVHVDDLLGEFPHFRPELDEEGSAPPPAVAAFRRAIADADGVLVSCPEYAHGVPGAFKNALDWIVSSVELTDKPVALLMASPSGAPHAWAALAPTLRVMGADLVHEASFVFARRHLADDGSVADEGVAAEVKKALEALAQAITRP